MRFFRMMHLPDKAVTGEYPSIESFILFPAIKNAARRTGRRRRFLSVLHLQHGPPVGRPAACMISVNAPKIGMALGGRFHWIFIPV